MFKRAFIAKRPFLPLKEQREAAIAAGASRIHELGRDAQTVADFLKVVRPGNMVMFLGEMR